MAIIYTNPRISEVDQRYRCSVYSDRIPGQIRLQYNVSQQEDPAYVCQMLGQAFSEGPYEVLQIEKDCDLRSGYEVYGYIYCSRAKMNHII